MYPCGVFYKVKQGGCPLLDANIHTHVQGVQKIEVTDLKVDNTFQNNKKVHINICPEMSSFRPIAILIFYFCHMVVQLILLTLQ